MTGFYETLIDENSSPIEPAPLDITPSADGQAKTDRDACTRRTRRQDREKNRTSDATWQKHWIFQI